MVRTTFNQLFDALNDRVEEQRDEQFLKQWKVHYLL